MRTSKRKTKRKSSRRSLVCKCSKERILQLSNDLSEGVSSGDVREWRAVALYFRNLFDQHSGLRFSLAALTIAEEMRANAISEISKWVKEQRNTD